MSLYILFLATSLFIIFLTTSLFITLLRLLKSRGLVFHPSMYNLPISDFKLAKSDFLEKSDVSTPAVFFKSDLTA